MRIFKLIGRKLLNTFGGNLILKEVKIRLDGEKYKGRLYIFNYCVLEWWFDNDRQRRFLFLPKQIRKNNKKNTNTPIFYLKVNRCDNYVFKCLQHWIDIIWQYGADFYIICDKKALKKLILTRVYFQNENVKFIKSVKKSFLRKIVKAIVSPYWENAAYAHLTTFYHAKKNNFSHFWNIDADDTMFAANADIVAKLLGDVEHYAKESGIKTFSLDMHRSRCNGREWNFGVSYTDNTIDWFDAITKNVNIKWQEWKHRFIADSISIVNSNFFIFNLDRYFTYLKDTNIYKIESFYFDEILFIHCGDYLSSIVCPGVLHFKNRKILLPILSDIFGIKQASNIPIYKDVIRIPSQLTEEDCFNFMRNFQLERQAYIINYWEKK